MKKLLTCTVIILAFVGTAYAIDWIGTNQSTVGWDAVDPIATGDTITYRVYSKKHPAGQPVVLDDTANLQYTHVFAEEGRYLTGVSAIRIPAGETEEIESTVTWSDSTDVEAVPIPFGLKYFESLSAPKGYGPK